VTQYEQPNKYLVESTNYSNEFGTPVLTAGKTFILGYTDEISGIYKASENPVIIFDDFTAANKWVDFDFKVKSSAIKIISSSDEGRFLIKYIYYWLSTLPSELVNSDHKRQWIGNYSNKRIPIPCPDNPKKSLEIQAEIVRILDKFDTLTTSLTEGLPREIELRQKQYEYYRDKLFTFKEVKHE
jgi:type I restriction enzyme S subunit